MRDVEKNRRTGMVPMEQKRRYFITAQQRKPPKPSWIPTLIVDMLGKMVSAVFNGSYFIW